jgi:cell division protein FtsX
MVSNRWRSRVARRLGVLLIALSLTLVMAPLLLWQGASNASESLKSGNEVTVWMSSGANAHEIHAVGTQLERLTYLRRPCT